MSVPSKITPPLIRSSWRVMLLRIVDFPGAVRSDQRDDFSFLDIKTDIPNQRLSLISDGKPIEGKILVHQILLRFLIII